MTTTEDRGSAESTPVRTAVRTAMLKLEGDYEGWEATVRVNPSLRTWEALGGDDVEPFREAFSSVILDWNFVDEQGEPMPVPQSENFDWMDMPWDLEQALVAGYFALITERVRVPKEKSTPSEPTSPNGT